MSYCLGGRESGGGRDPGGPSKEPGHVPAYPYKGEKDKGFILSMVTPHGRGLVLGANAASIFRQLIPVAVRTMVCRGR